MYSVLIRLKTPLLHKDVDDARHPKPPSRGLKQYHVLWAWLFIDVEVVWHLIAFYI